MYPILNAKHIKKHVKANGYKIYFAYTSVLKNIFSTNGMINTNNPMNKIIHLIFMIYPKEQYIQTK